MAGSITGSIPADEGEQTIQIAQAKRFAISRLSLTTRLESARRPISSCKLLIEAGLQAGRASGFQAR
jgi:hypothetical protein